MAKNKNKKGNSKKKSSGVFKKKPKSSLIMMSSKEFLKKFVPTEDEKVLNDYQIVVVSDKIKVKGKYYNLSNGKMFMPPKVVMHEYKKHKKFKKFRKAYMQYLESLEIKIELLALVKMLFEGDDVVIVCSEKEKDLGILDVLKEFFKKKFKIESFTYSQFKSKNTRSIKSPKKTEEVFYNEYHLAESRGDDSAKSPVKKTFAGKLKAQLKLISKDDLVMIAESRGVSKPKKLSKKELIAQLIEVMS